MPSVEYTKSKGLVQKSSQEASLSLQGVMSGQRRTLESLTSASHQLTVADSGKELLLSKTNGQSILLPAVAGVRTDLKLTAQQKFTPGTTIDFSVFGASFKLQVVANNAVALTGQRIDSTGAVSATGDRFALRDGGADAAGSAGVLRTLLGGVQDFVAISDVTIAGNAAEVTMRADKEGASNNGTVTISEAADLVVTDEPNNGQDTISDASGLRIKLVVNAALGTDVTVAIPTDRLDGANSQGAFVGTVLVTGNNVPAQADTMTIDQSKDTIGDYYEFICDGNTTSAKWYVSGVAKTADAVSFA